MLELGRGRFDLLFDFLAVGGTDAFLCDPAAKETRNSVLCGDVGCIFRALERALLRAFGQIADG
eukprot:11169170-Lingulodinium_polyedra.AAC.1